MTRKALLLSVLIMTLSYFLSGQGLNMTLEGNYDNSNYTYNDCWGYTDASGNEYAILGSRTKVLFLDITAPTLPTLIAEFTGAAPGIVGANSIWRDFKTYDRYAYAVADSGSEGLMVFDLSKIHNGIVNKVYQKNNRFVRAHNIFIDVPHGKLYVIGSNTQNAGLIVYDIATDPSNPIHLASVDVSGGYIHDAYVYDNIVYASSGYDGLYIIDMTNPATPIYKSDDETTAAGYNHSGWPYDNGNKMLVAEEVPQGLKLGIYDISDLNNINHISSFRDPINTSGSGFPTYHNPYMVGDTAVISSYEDGITIMGLGAGNAPDRIAHYDTYTNTNYNGYNGCWGAYPYFPSGTIIGSDISTGLYVLSTTLDLKNTCTNGIKDDFEIDIDCGGFCNTCECSAPTDMVFSDVTATEIQIDWSAVNTAVGYEVRYRESGTSSWAMNSATTNMIVISGLQPNTSYDFQIRADCSNRITPYATSVSYTTGSCLSQIRYSGPQESGEYETVEYIRSHAQLVPGSDIAYFSGDSIMLGQKFSVELNTTFLAEVDRPCGAPAFTGQVEMKKYYHVEPANIVEAFTVIEHSDAGVFYIVSNQDGDEPYTVTILNTEGSVIAKSEHSAANKLTKFNLADNQHSVIIKKEKSTMEFILEK